MPPPPHSEETRGVQGICHLLTDAARLHKPPIRRLEAVHWAMSIANLVSAHVQSHLDPEESLAEYLRHRGVTQFVRERANLPGDPCSTCIATQMLPAVVATDVVALAKRLGCSPAEAFLWASRLGAIVMASPMSAGASSPQDALSALVIGEYVAQARRLHCDLTSAA